MINYSGEERGCRRQKSEYPSETVTIDRQRSVACVRRLLLKKLPTGSWQGRGRSGYGIHLVYLADHIVGRVPDVTEVRDAVVRDYQRQLREEAKQTFYAS